jgi:hypothetical protein
MRLAPDDLRSPPRPRRRPRDLLLAGRNGAITAIPDKDSVTVTRATAARYHLTSMQGETK